MYRASSCQLNVSRPLFLTLLEANLAADGGLFYVVGQAACVAENKNILVNYKQAELKLVIPLNHLRK